MVWPHVDELKQLLDVTSDEWDAHLDELMTAAIDKVKKDVGEWDEDDDEPDESLAKAALRAAVLMRPNASEGLKALRQDTVYASLMLGKRRRFAIG